MQTEEIRKSLNQACGDSPTLRKILLQLMNWMTLKTWHIRRELRKWMRSSPEKAHILDLGTGFGHNAYWLSCQKERFSILAIDDKQERIVKGNAFVRDTQCKNLLFRTKDLPCFKENEAFDLILCTDTLEHIKEDQQTLENMHASLRDEGMMITTASLKYGEESEIEGEFHRMGYSMEGLKSHFKNAGFRKVKGHYTGGKAGKLSHLIGIGIPMKLLKFSRLFMLLLPFYFFLAIPIVILLNWLDSQTAHLNGEGLLILAWK